MRTVAWKCLDRAVAARGSHLHRAARLQAIVAVRGYRKISWPVSPSDCQVWPASELQRQDAHADEIAAVDALVADGDHGAHAQQKRAFGGPVAAAARAIFGCRPAPPAALRSARYFSDAS